MLLSFCLLSSAFSEIGPERVDDASMSFLALCVIVLEGNIKEYVQELYCRIWYCYVGMTVLPRLVLLTCVGE